MCGRVAWVVQVACTTHACICQAWRSAFRAPMSYRTHPSCSFEAVEVDLSEGKLPPLPDADFVVHVSGSGLG